MGNPGCQKSHSEWPAETGLDVFDVFPSQDAVHQKEQAKYYQQLGQKTGQISTSHDQKGPQMVVNCKGNSPGYFREIDGLVKYYEPFGQKKRSSLKDEKRMKNRPLAIFFLASEDSCV